MSARCAGCSETENGQEQGELRAAANKATMFQPVRGCEQSEQTEGVQNPHQSRLVAIDTYFMEVGFRNFGRGRTPSVKMPDGILPAPPTGGAFWWGLVFVEIICVFWYLESIPLAFSHSPAFAIFPTILSPAMPTSPFWRRTDSRSRVGISLNIFFTARQAS